MKKVLFAFFPWLLCAFGYKAIAQDELPGKKEKQETQEIIIRKKGSKDSNINIQINGDEVLVNGKPLVEFKDDGITINKKKVIIRDGDRMIFSDGHGDFGPESFRWNDEDAKPRAFLGVSTEKTADGAKITEEVSKESAAGKAGLQKDDIITKVGDDKVDGPKSLLDAVTSRKPKDEVKISYLRNGKSKTTKAVLQEKKSMVKSFSFSRPDGSSKTFTMPPMPPEGWNGMDPEDLITPQMHDQLRNLEMNINTFPRRQKLGLKIQDTEDGNGIKVLEVDDSSAAALAGLKKDDIITEIGGEKVTNTDEAREQLHENAEKGNYKIKARRNGSEMNFDIKIPKKLKTANL